jgi:hypothetical protein
MLPSRLAPGIGLGGLRPLPSRPPARAGLLPLPVAIGEPTVNDLKSNPRASAPRIGFETISLLPHRNSLTPRNGRQSKRAPTCPIRASPRLVRPIFSNSRACRGPLPRQNPRSRTLAAEPLSPFSTAVAKSLRTGKPGPWPDPLRFAERRSPIPHARAGDPRRRSRKSMVTGAESILGEQTHCFSWLGGWSRAGGNQGRPPGFKNRSCYVRGTQAWKSLRAPYTGLG